MTKYAEYLALLLLPITAIVLIAFQSKALGFGLLVLGGLVLIVCSKKFRRDILLIYAGLAILGIAPINTKIDFPHMLIMGFLLSLAIAVPYYISRFIFKDHHVRFTFHHGRKWSNIEIGYIFLTGTVTYFAFPYLLRATGSYHNWTVLPGVGNLALLFLGTNMLGIWDELFFVNTVLGILRNYLRFPLANFLQAILFTSFLYELGFRSWFFIIIFFFALLQGYIFKKTESLFYIITIHLTADLVLYFALIYLHHPTWIRFFIT